MFWLSSSLFYVLFVLYVALDKSVCTVISKQTSIQCWLSACVYIQAPDECQQETARLRTQLKNLEIQFQKQQQQIQRLRSLRDQTSTNTDEFIEQPGQTEHTGE